NFEFQNCRNGQLDDSLNIHYNDHCSAWSKPADSTTRRIMNALLISTVLLGFVSQAAAQCSTSQSTNCVNWVRNGFCNNMAYSLAQRQASCGISCGLCTSSGQPITPGVCTADANANCANWVRNGFCTNSAYTEAVKQAYCCKSCAPATTTTTGTTMTTTT
ncbi:hypothetical protein PENTCL1PPCAC_16938, partial [Pristionchus entomophagus]